MPDDGLMDGEKPKRRKAVPMTARSLQFLRKRGYIAAVVERRIPHSFVTVDAFGFGDILACKPGVPGALLVQTTTAGHLPDRVAKAELLDAFHDWLAAGNQVEFHGWSKRGAAGKRKLWSVVVRYPAQTAVLTLDKLPAPMMPMSAVITTLSATEGEPESGETT